MKSKYMQSLFALAVVILAVPSCIVVSDGGHHLTRHGVSRDLEDLEDARDKGLLSQGEYDRARSRILDDEDDD